MTEQEFEQRWAELTAAEGADLAREQARARADAEARLTLKLEKIEDKIREAHARPKALLIHEALTPDKYKRHLFQERLAELAGMSVHGICDYDRFGHWQTYCSTPAIKPTLQNPLFFERLTLTHFLRLLQKTDAQVGPRSAYPERHRDYERRFDEVIQQVNAGAGQPVTREDVYALLEKLAGRKNPTPVAALVQHLEQQYPDRPVTDQIVKNAIGTFKKKGDFYTETVDTPQGPAVRVRRLKKVNPQRAQAAIEELSPLLAEIIELAGRTTARTSLVRISANAQKVLRALKDLQTWAETQ
jgi:hypothetical protein